MRPRLRIVLAVVLGLTVVLAVGTLVPGCTVGYVTQQGRFQAELLAGRVPVDKAIADGLFEGERLVRLRQVAAIKDFGARLGLSATHNYDTVNPRWNRTIWNVSACDPLAFEARTWWFPIVGRVPYLGFFRREDAEPWMRRMEARGADVYARTAGAYSTLGWFRDPILPSMLDWTEYQLANTVLHELAHATVWVPGSVSFNESFASFVGDEASRRYLAHTYGPDAPELAATQSRIDDRRRFLAMQQDVYEALDAVYSSESTTREEKLAEKARILASIPQRTRDLGLHEPDRYLRWVADGPWNNARLMQFRTYNRSPEWFADLLASEGGDLLAFMHRIKEVTRGADDPYRALAAAVHRESEWEPEQ